MLTVAELAGPAAGLLVAAVLGAWPAVADDPAAAAAAAAAAATEVEEDEEDVGAC